MQRIRNAAHYLWDYAVITFACVIYAIAFNCFFYSNSFSMGGFTGLAQCLNYLFPVLPIGMVVLLMNIPLMIIGVQKQGMKMLVSTLYAVTVSSALIDGLDLLYTFPETDSLLGCVFGGVLLGAAMGLMMKRGTTTGGTELAARLLKYRFRHLSIGKLCLVIDVLVVLLHALTFHSINASLYGIIAMYITSITMDMVVYGSVGAKLALIISDQSAAIQKELLNMNLGVTILDGKGGWSGDHKNVILCVFKRNQIAAIKAAATAIDDKSFIIVCEAHEVLGEGFGAYSPDSL